MPVALKRGQNLKLGSPHTFCRRHNAKTRVHVNVSYSLCQPVIQLVISARRYCDRSYLFVSQFVGWLAGWFVRSLTVAKSARLA